MKKQLFAVFCILLTTCATDYKQLPSYDAVRAQSLKEVGTKPEKDQVMLEIADFDDENVNALILKMQELKDSGITSLWIRINSNGGSVDSGIRLAQAMEDLKVPTTCVADSKALSMGFYFMQFCDVRLATKRSLLMIHAPKMGAEGGERQMREAEEVLHAITISLADVCAERMTLSRDELMMRMSQGDWWMSWDEALKVGAIDGIIAPKDMPQVTRVEVKKKSLLDILRGD